MIDKINIFVPDNLEDIQVMGMTYVGMTGEFVAMPNRDNKSMVGMRKKSKLNFEDGSFMDYINKLKPLSDQEVLNNHGASGDWIHTDPKRQHPYYFVYNRVCNVIRVKELSLIIDQHKKLIKKLTARLKFEAEQTESETTIPR